MPSVRGVQARCHPRANRKLLRLPQFPFDFSTMLAPVFYIIHDSYPSSLLSISGFFPFMGTIWAFTTFLLFSLSPSSPTASNVGQHVFIQFDAAFLPVIQMSLVGRKSPRLPDLLRVVRFVLHLSGSSLSSDLMPCCPFDDASIYHGPSQNSLTGYSETSRLTHAPSSPCFYPIRFQGVLMPVDTRSARSNTFPTHPSH